MPIQVTLAVKGIIAARRVLMHDFQPRVTVRGGVRVLDNISSLSIIVPLVGEPPEPITKEQFEADRKRLRATLNGVVTMTSATSERLLAEVIWLKRRLHRAELIIRTVIPASPGRHSDA